MPKRTKGISTDGKSSEDIFADPKHQQSMHYDRQETHSGRTSRKRPSNIACERTEKTRRRRRAFLKELQLEKDCERKQTRYNNPTNDIFADPNEPQAVQKDIGHLRSKHDLNDKSSVLIETHSLKHPDLPEYSKSQQAHEKKRRKNKQQRQLMSRASDPRNHESFTILNWNSPVGYVPLSEEESIVRFIFQRNGKKERGMMKGKPPFVVRKYKEALGRCAPSMNLPQVLSLRRHHIKLFHESKTMPALGLGSINHINQSARIFERAVENFLRKSAIDFLTEEDQKRAAAEVKKVLEATPDFLLPKPVLLRKIRKKKSKKGRSIEKPDVVEERTIHWIEAKMFYGASTIPHGSKGAVGKVLSTARKYFKNHGEGAILFMMGCGDKLAADLNDAGVSVLDCAGNTVCLHPVHDHQRTWCADEKGQILP